MSSPKSLSEYVTSPDFDPSCLEERRLLLRFEVDKLIQRDLNGDGLPDFIEVGGAVIHEGQGVGKFGGTFQGAPVMLALPDTLKDNTFAIEVGTLLPAWFAPVSYDLKWGRLDTTEIVWVFPSDLSNPESPLIVLSVSNVIGGTGAFSDIVHGKVVTHDSIGGTGALDCTFYSEKSLDLA